MSTTVLLRCARLHMSELRGNPSLVVIGLVQPAAVQTLLLTRTAPADARQAGALVIGTSLLAVWSATVWSAGMLLRREIRLGTLASVLSRPTDLRWIVAGKALGSGTATLLSTLLVALVLPAALGYRLHLASPALLLLAVALTLASATAVGTLLAGVFLTTRAAARIAEALLFPVFLLSGALIPLKALPTLLRWPSGLLDLRWLRELALAALDDSARPSPALWSAAASLLVCIALQYAAAHRLFGRLVGRLHREGSLDHR